MHTETPHLHNIHGVWPQKIAYEDSPFAYEVCLRMVVNNDNNDKSCDGGRQRQTTMTLWLCLVVFYRVIYRVITKFYPKPLIWARVAVKCMIAVKLPPLLAYPTLPYLITLLKSSFQYHRKSTEQQRYLQRNDTNDTIVCGKITAVSTLWRRAARRRRRWR
jgi:hypothetical protein